MDDEKQEITIDLYTALEMENDIVEERAPEIEKNQKLGLLLGFLSVHDWYTLRAIDLGCSIIILQSFF
jgi:THO complex subunit 2